MKTLLLLCSIFCIHICYGQNVGIGTLDPKEKLEVAGTTKTNGLQLAGGNQSDFLKKGIQDSVVFSKGHNGQGLNYIIAIQGIYPSTNGGTYPEPILGEVRLFAGNFAPSGFLFCHGQLLPINQYQALFSLLEFRYGGNNTTHFALPDLRGAVPVGTGTTGSGPNWTLGERSK